LEDTLPEPVMETLWKNGLKRAKDLKCDGKGVASIYEMD